MMEHRGLRVARRRLFIAAELPEDLRQELVLLQQRLRRSNPPVRWVDPATMHLTLWFLGDVAEEQLPHLTLALTDAFADQVAVTVHLTHVGAFPNVRRPSVIWAGLTDDQHGLRAWYASLARQLDPLGFPAESRPFQPHLTLGRVRREASAEQQTRLGATIRTMTVSVRDTWSLRHIALFQSELHPEGPRHTPLARVDLVE